jgi:hypothetical protein
MASKKNFSSIGAGLITSAEQPAEEASTGKAKVTTFEIEPTLDKQLDRMVYHKGRKATKKEVINLALAYYFANSPEGKKNANRPTPDEE